MPSHRTGFRIQRPFRTCPTRGKIPSTIIGRGPSYQFDLAAVIDGASIEQLDVSLEPRRTSDRTPWMNTCDKGCEEQPTSTLDKEKRHCAATYQSTKHQCEMKEQGKEIKFRETSRKRKRSGANKHVCSCFSVAAPRTKVPCKRVLERQWQVFSWPTLIR